MSIISVPFEKWNETGASLSIDIPDRNLARKFIPEEPKGIADIEAALLEAVESPAAGKKFSELIGPGVKVTFVTENQFRSAPANKLLMPLLRRALDARAEVTVAIGCGTLPPLSGEEIENKLGREVVETGVPIECNDIRQPENYTFLGNTSAGIPLWVLNSVAKADVVITIGTTQATLWGYGGSGMIVPAVSGNETIEMNHVMCLAPDCVPGNNECKMQLDKYEALRIAGVDMGINVIVANNWDTIFINAGEPERSHKEAVEYYEKIYQFDVRGCEKFDIVLVGSTAPTDHLFFHSGWAIVNCAPVVRDGGTIIFCSPCPGYYDWPGFALTDLMKAFMPSTPESHEKVLKAFYKKERDLASGSVWYPIFRTMLKKDVQIVTLPGNIEMAGNAGLNAEVSLEEAMTKALTKHGENARVAFVPFGRYTIFKVGI